MPKETDTSIVILDPSELSQTALDRCRSAAERLHMARSLLLATRLQDADDLIKAVINVLGNIDADLRTLRDVACNDVYRAVLEEKGELLFAYTPRYRCPHTGHPLRFPLVWNQTDLNGEYISNDK